MLKYRDLTDRVYGVPGYWSLRECQRGDCGTLWLDPRPTLASIPKAYANYYTHADHQPSLLSLYLRLVHFLALGRAVRHYGYPATLLPRPLSLLGSVLAILYPGMRAQLDHFIRYLPFSSLGGGQLLDVGCGAFDVGPLLRDLGWHVHGVEVDPEAVHLARGQGLDVREGTLTPSPPVMSSSMCMIHWLFSSRPGDYCDRGGCWLPSPPMPVPGVMSAMAEAGFP